MADWPSSLVAPWPTISAFSLESLGAPLNFIGLGQNAIASAVWPTANLAMYVPFALSRRITVTKLWSYNGAAVSGNIDVGIYDAQDAGPGNRLVSAGTTAQAGTNVLQIFDVTDTVLGPGLFYLAIALDNGTGALFRTAPAAEYLRMFGCFQQATAFPLPATATPATMASAYMTPFGLVHGRTAM